MAAASSSDFKIFGIGMAGQVIIAMILGILTGYFLGKDAEVLKVFGTVFIKLIKMVVAPLIFCALLMGITSISEEGNFKRIAMRGTVAYMSTALMAVALGLFIGSVFEPGVGLPKPDGVIPPELSAAPPPSIGTFLMGLIPGNLIHALADDMYLQIVVFAIFTGITMNHLRDKTKKVKELNKEFAAIIFQMIEWIVRLSPMAIFGFMASLVGTTGFELIVSLFELMALVIGACAIQYLFFGFLISVFGRISPMPFYRKLLPTQILAFSTSSSKATLTTAMRELEEKMGVSKSTSNFMMPLGASINMDGTAIYLGIVSVFFAQLYGVHLEFEDYLMLMLTCTLGSIGAAGIPSGSIIFMGMVLSSVGIPMEGIVMILGIDRILDMFRTTINITGDSAITLIIDKVEGTLDMKEYNR